MEYLNTKPFYTLVDKTSFNLYELISTDLTLDLNSQTGFKEIAMIKPWKTDIKDDYEKTIIDRDFLCQTLLSLLEESVEKCWNPEDKHVVFISGGIDSRILCYTIKKLEQKNGKDWLGEVKFLTRFEAQNSENLIDSVTIAKDLMKKLKWKQKHMVSTSIDFSPQLIPNAFSAYDLSFYSPLSLDYKELKTWVAISGNYGGEQTQYPFFKGRTNDRFSDLTRWLDVSFSFAFHTFKDFLQPYLYKPYIYTCFKIHESLFTSEHPLGRSQDENRNRMLEMLGDTLATYWNHDYSIMTEEQKKEQIKLAQELWDNSQFRKDFSEQLDQYRDMKIENISNKEDIKSKLFGLAMTYDFGRG